MTDPSRGNTTRTPHVLRCTSYDRTDTEIDRAVGCTLYTVDGREIVDMESGVWAVALGHNHPRINGALRAQLDRISHIGYRVSAAIQDDAAAALLESAGLTGGRCVFLSSGSEAVEFSVQIARRVTGRPLLLTLTESFLSSYGSAGTKRPEEWALFDRAGCADCPSEHPCDGSCPRLAEIPFDRIGAMVFEPASAGGFIRFPQEKLIRALCRRVRSAGGLVVVNEVTTGIGRTGTWYGFEHAGLRPDLIAVGKGLGNGYPVSAVAMRGEVADAVEHLIEKGFHYAQSHQNDPLGCAVATEVLRVIREEGLVERCADVGATFREGLEEIATAHPVVRDVRGRGLMLAIEFAADRDGFVLDDLFARLLDRGFLVGYKPEGNLLRFFPPLTIPETDLARLLQTLDELLR